MAKKRKIVTENYPTAKAAMAEKLALDGTVDGIVNERYTDEAGEDMEELSGVRALNEELRELKVSKKRKKK